MTIPQPPERKPLTTAQQARRDKLNAQRRVRRAANPQSHRDDTAKWAAKNVEYRRLRSAQYRHGPDVASAIALMWEQQGGKCYLCGIFLVPEAVVIDHDHRCCQVQTSCPACRRGLACDYCNTLIGLANDDPTLLRQIADNLEAKLTEVTARLAENPQQLGLEDGAS